MGEFALKNIKLNDQQEMALTKLMDWWRHPWRQYFEVSGLAGTGKTTLIRYLIEKLGLDPDLEVAFMAYVGKATLAMKMQGIDAKTIHSTITIPEIRLKRDKNGEPLRDAQGKKITEVKFIKRPQLSEDLKLLVVDEGAMVPEYLANWILSYKLPVIVLGDINQLPPVMGSSFFLSGKPDVQLTEIMRTSKDSNIPYLGKMVLENKVHFSRPFKIGPDIEIKPFSDTTPEEVKKSNIVLCWRNTVRKELNDSIRKNIYGFDAEYPMIGDRIVCRENNWDMSITSNDIVYYLVNGMVGYVEDIDLATITKNTMNITFRPEFLSLDKFEHITLDRKFMNLPYGQKKEYMSNFEKFEFAYALTCHLAQGSEYENVFVDVRDLRYMRNRDEARRWLYTAVTRATKHLIIAY